MREDTTEVRKENLVNNNSNKARWSTIWVTAVGGCDVHQLNIGLCEKVNCDNLSQQYNHMTS